jgi:hypothetical protein
MTPPKISGRLLPTLLLIGLHLFPVSTLRRLLESGRQRNEPV